MLIVDIMHDEKLLETKINCKKKKVIQSHFIIRIVSLRAGPFAEGRRGSNFVREVI
jgi:hypothetical protein